MPDFIDQTEEREQYRLDATIANIRKRAANINIYGNGECIVCEAEAQKVGDKFSRFCGEECCREFERNQ